MSPISDEVKSTVMMRGDAIPAIVDRKNSVVLAPLYTTSAGFAPAVVHALHAMCRNGKTCLLVPLVGNTKLMGHKDESHIPPYWVPAGE